MSDFNEIINSEKPTLVDFFATWCGPCQMLSPILEEVSSEVGDTAKVLKVDIEIDYRNENSKFSFQEKFSYNNQSNKFEFEQYKKKRYSIFS